MKLEKKWYEEYYFLCFVVLFFVGDLRDDSNLDFIKEYNRVLVVVCDDFFFVRYKRITGLS